MVSTATNIQEVPTRLLSTRKRSRSEAESSHDEAIKRSCYGLGKLLDYKNSGVSDSEASVLSLQNYETDLPHDTPFDDTSSEYDSSDVVEIEYECMTDSDHGSFRSDISTGDEATLAAGVIAAVLCDSSLESWFTDREEDSDNSSVEGAELERTKWRLCIQCKGENNNPLYRYCQECFQKRKEFFPPRPKGFKKRDELKEKIKKKSKSKTCSQDSGIGSFDSDILETQSEQNGLKRKRGSDEEDAFESENENSKRLKLDFSRIGSNNNLLMKEINDNCHEVPILTIHTDKNHSVSDKKTDDVDKIANDADELATTKKNKSGWVMTSITIDNDDKEVDTTLKENCEVNSRSFAVTKELCMMCASVTKDSIFLHGTTGHLACCYQCSIKTWKTTKCCPVCKAKVRNVVKIYS